MRIDADVKKAKEHECDLGLIYEVEGEFTLGGYKQYGTMLLSELEYIKLQNDGWFEREFWHG